MKFAVANQFFMIADQAGVDYTNVLRAIREDYPRAADLPGPGFAAGPCLFKDTMQLAAFTSDHFPMGQAAMQVNEGLPAYIVAALERRYGGLQGKTVGILGMAFKAESDDTRASLSLQAAQAAVVGRRSRRVHRPVRRGRPARRPSSASSRRATSWSSARRTGRTGSLDVGGKDVVDVWGALGRGHPGSASHQACHWPYNPRPRVKVPMRILVTGAAGFINGYLVPELLEAGHEVVGLDDFSKYGRLTKSYDDHPCYRFVEGDAKDAALLTRARRRLRPGRRRRGDDRRDQLLPRVRLRPARRERADPRVDVRRGDRGPPRRPPRADHRRVSSSMVYESATVFPTPEGAQLTSPPPISTYGFQKLASEYFAKGAWEQYQLPYTIVRPFNCVGIGERRALRDTDIMSGNVKLALSHVVPDLVLKVLKGQDPLHILGDGSPGPPLHLRRRPGPRHPAGDGVAEGRQRGLQPVDRASTTVLELARADLAQDPRPGPRRSATCPTRRSSTTSSCACRTSARRARSSGFEATTTLDTMLDEVIPWIRGRGGGRPAVSRLLPELYDARFDEREVSAKDAVWREIVALPRNARSTRRAGPRHRLRPRPLHPVGSRVASAGRRTSVTCRADLPRDVRFVQASGLDLGRARADRATSARSS